MHTTLKLAHHLPTIKIIHIEMAKNGLDCQCICGECGEKMQTIREKVRDQRFWRSQSRWKI
jgi:hypothetical protein